MFAIEVNFLTGRYVATAHHDRGRPEWPPHPARLFSALVATWADDDSPDQVERTALEWLEAQGPPSIAAPDAEQRTVVTHFVPVNDARIVPQRPYENRARAIARLEWEIEEAQRSEATKRVRSLESRLRKQRDVSAIVSSVGNTPVKSAVDILPPGWISASDKVRTGQARNYPSVTLKEPRVTYMWESSPSADLVRAVDDLCARLTRLGHSSSLVACRVVGNGQTPNLVPGEGGTVLRSVGPGQLDALEREYTRH
ncbi:MAG: type I-U CRISPR-associated protein Csb2 [bacterium]|nr:type I-U CRISPR-associated protein Csb2 [bacterium]